MMDERKKTILFLCTGNSCRSQMAEGFAKRELEKWNVLSAGVLAESVHAMAIEVMAEKKIDISGQRSKSIADLGSISPDVVITLCEDASKHCPHYPGVTHTEHWDIHDPIDPRGDEKKLDIFRNVRDEIENRVVKLSSSI